MEIEHLREIFIKNVDLFFKEFPEEVPSFTQIFNKNGQLIGEGYNSVEKNMFTTSHSEILAIEKSQKLIRNKFLIGCHLITLLEPCTMCAGAIIQARIKSVTYFVEQKKIPGISYLSPEYIITSNHFPKLVYIPDNRLEEVLQVFFKKLR